MLCWNRNNGRSSGDGAWETGVGTGVMNRDGVLSNGDFHFRRSLTATIVID